MPGARLAPYERMRVWHESVAPGSDAVLQFDAADVGEPNLGYIAESQLLQWALLEAFAQAGGHLERASLESLEISEAGVSVVTGRGRLAARSPSAWVRQPGRRHSARGAAVARAA